MQDQPSALAPIFTSAIIRHQPELMRQEQAKADAIIGYAIEIRDWPLVIEAIEEKISQQREFVAWWDAKVAIRESIGSNQWSNAERGSTMRRVDAEDHTGIKQQQVSRWRQALKDAERYRDKQILAAYRKAGLEPPENHRAEGTGENEWFTPPEYIEAARAVMGGIDLDPASNPIAQEWIKAERYFTRRDDGLSHEWHGRVWLNPPYARTEIAPFVQKLVTEIEAGHVTAAITLTHNYTDTEWFHLLLSVAEVVCFTRGRVRFVDDLGNECAPTQGQTFFYWGERQEQVCGCFGILFSKFGAIMEPVR